MVHPGSTCQHVLSFILELSTTTPSFCTFQDMFHGGAGNQPGFVGSDSGLVGIFLGARGRAMEGAGNEF